MLVLVTSTFPGHQGPKVTQIFNTPVEPAPQAFRTVYILVQPDVEVGMMTHVIMDVKQGEEEKGLAEIRQVMAAYLVVEGYKYSIDVVTSVAAPS